MVNLLALGEGMLELKFDQQGQLINKFAGDTLNAAIYAKRWSNKLTVQFFSAIGQDTFSNHMIDYLTSENINTNSLLRSFSNNIGIYAIETDEHGERSFNYWRKDSAATQMMKMLKDLGGAETLPASEIIFFSGISLAILSDEDKEYLFDIIAAMKQKGSKIAFDPNYRAKMWRDEKHAIEWFTRAFQISNIVLPGLDEQQDLFNQKSVEDVTTFMLNLGVNEVIIKAGKDGVYGVSADNENCHVAFNPAPKQIDSTAAGDSFAGTYLSSRLTGDSIKQSIINADSVAREVVQHSGAIIDEQIYNQLFNK